MRFLTPPENEFLKQLDYCNKYNNRSRLTYYEHAITFFSSDVEDTLAKKKEAYCLFISKLASKYLLPKLDFTRIVDDAWEYSLHVTTRTNFENTKNIKDIPNFLTSKYKAMCHCHGIWEAFKNRAFLNIKDALINHEG